MGVRERVRRLDRGSWLETRWQRDATPSLDPSVLAIWERMPPEHRDWARRAATQGVVADHPHHARILADLGAQYRRHRARLLVWMIVPLLLLTATQVGAVAGDPGRIGPWLAVAAPALGALGLASVDALTRRAVRANARRAEQLLVLPDAGGPVDGGVTAAPRPVPVVLDVVAPDGSLEPQG